MTKKIFKYTLIAHTLLLFGSCKKPYAPPAIASGASHLVVEGVINTGSDSTIFKLSRTVDLSGNKRTPELNASVAVENDQGTDAVYYLNEMGNGKYAFAGLNLDTSRRYRIRIKTNDGREYVSDFVTSQFTPVIDSIGFNIKNNGLQIYVNTHNANNNTKYYRWDYEETWQFHAKYPSTYISNGTAVVPRTPAQNIYYCFANNISSDINLGSSARLTEDNIYQSPITFIPSTSEKIELKYSILVRQYAVTKEAFAFWQNLKKNTEQLGSIFDAQPSEISGNIHCLSNPSEPVIGYVNACLVRTKRIFISNRQLPTTWAPVYPYACDQDSNYYVHPITGRNDVAANLIPLPSAVIITNPFFFMARQTQLDFFQPVLSAVIVLSGGPINHRLFGNKTND